MATHKVYDPRGVTVKPHTNLVLGPRLAVEIRSRVRELKGRLHPTMKDHAELVRLEELLRSMGGSSHV